MNIICFGDSITAAKDFPEGQRYPALLQQRLDEWRPGRYHVFGRGVGGDTTTLGFDRFPADVLTRMPGVAVLQFGFNDAVVREWTAEPRVSLQEYARKLRAFVRAVRRRGGACVLIVNHIPGPGWTRQGDGRSYPRRVARYNAAVRAVAAQTGAHLADLPALLKQRRVDPQVFLKDCVHLSAEGNKIYAALVFERLREVLDG